MFVDMRIVILVFLTLNNEVCKLASYLIPLLALKPFALLKQQHLFMLGYQPFSVLALAPFPVNVESWEEALQCKIALP